MIVYVADAHAHVQRLVSVVKTATLFEEFTTEEHCPVVRFFCGRKDSMQTISYVLRFISICDLFTDPPPYILATTWKHTYSKVILQAS
jgi:hypothetical protein